jgi:hypothetical protein
MDPAQTIVTEYEQLLHMKIQETKQKFCQFYMEQEQESLQYEATLMVEIQSLAQKLAATTVQAPSRC